MDTENDISGAWTGSEAQTGSDFSIRRVTVRQLHEATPIHSTSLSSTHSTPSFHIDGGQGFKKLMQIIIVANLCFLDIGQTFTDFGLDDGTGRIRARQWHYNSSSDPPDETFDTRNFPYIQVIGDLEEFKSKKSIKVTHVRKISSPYELYYHILHTICDTLVYERGPPSSKGKNRDPAGDTTTEDPDILHHDGTITSPSLPPVVDITPDTTARSDTYAEPIPQSANPKVDKGKGPIPTQPVHSTLVPILPTPDRHAGDVGISEHSDGAHDASISPGSNYRNTASEAPLGSFPSTLVQPHTRRFTPNDPYSKLTSVQRDVLLCIKNAAEHIPTPSVYPTHDLDPSSEHNPTWKGVHVSVIIQSVTNRHPELELGLPEFMDCFDGLLEEGHIYNPVDEEHYSCT